MKMSNNKDLSEAIEEVNKIKAEIETFVRGSKYIDVPDEDQERTAQEMKKYIETIVELIVKRKQIKFEFQAGGSSKWFSELFMILSKLLAADKKLNDVLERNLNELDS